MMVVTFNYRLEEYWGAVADVFPTSYSDHQELAKLKLLLKQSKRFFVLQHSGYLTTLWR